MTDKELRSIGRYAVEEHTARRLVVETERQPLFTVGMVWAMVVIVGVPIAPWHGGTRLLAIAALSVLALVVSLLLVWFTPRRERVTVDIETGLVQIERLHLLPPASHTEQILLADVASVRCRRKVWRDGARAEVVRWAVELVTGTERVWQLFEEKEEEQVQELARLVAEVAGRPLSE